MNPITYDDFRNIMTGHLVTLKVIQEYNTELIETLKKEREYRNKEYEEMVVKLDKFRQEKDEFRQQLNDTASALEQTKIEYRELQDTWQNCLNENGELKLKLADKTNEVLTVREMLQKANNKIERLTK
jgi:chromosome segregation ATPase